MMTKGEGSDAPLRELVARAPMAMGIVAGEDMRLETGEARLAPLVGGARCGSSLREAVTLRLGQPFVEAVDAVRAHGRSHRCTVERDDERWAVWLERLDSERVGIYIMPERSPARELVHALRNPIFGIRTATNILVRRQLDDETRAVLEQIESAAERAEVCLKSLTPGRSALPGAGPEAPDTEDPAQ